MNYEKISMTNGQTEINGMNQGTNVNSTVTKYMTKFTDFVVSVMVSIQADTHTHTVKSLNYWSDQINFLPFLFTSLLIHNTHAHTYIKSIYWPIIFFSTSNELK